MIMAMKTLEEFNNGKRANLARMQALNQPHPNGIKCPECGEELWDSDPTVILSNFPPQKEIHCPACGYKGCRLV